MNTVRMRNIFRHILPCFTVFALLGHSQVLAQSTTGKGALFTINASKPVATPETSYLGMGSSDTGQSPGRSTVSVNSRYLMLDGKPWLPVMGSFTIVDSRSNIVHIVVRTPEMAENSWKLRLDGREHMLITKANVFAADDTIHLRSRDSNLFSVSIFPKLKNKHSSNAALKKKGDNGIFTHYIASIEEENIAVYLSQIRKAGTVPPVKIGTVLDWRNGEFSR